VSPTTARLRLTHKGGIIGASVVMADSFVEGHKALLMVLYYGLRPIFTNYPWPHYGYMRIHRHYGCRKRGEAADWMLRA